MFNWYLVTIIFMGNTLCYLGTSVFVVNQKRSEGTEKSQKSEAAKRPVKTVKR